MDIYIYKCVWRERDDVVIGIDGCSRYIDKRDKEICYCR